MQNSMAFFPNGTKKLNRPCFYRQQTSNSPNMSKECDFLYFFSEIPNFSSTSDILKYLYKKEAGKDDSVI